MRFLKLNRNDPLASNKVLLASRLGLAGQEALVEPYKRAIRDEFDPERGLPCLSLRAARKALNDFKKASANSRAIADLMFYYVEQGVACTLKYGDIDESFYSSLESVMTEAIKYLRKTGDPDMIEEFRLRLKSIVARTGGIGWGFHDYLTDLYHDEYPAES